MFIKKVLLSTIMVCFLSAMAFGALLGDVNGDGAHTIVDALLIAQISVGIESVPADPLICDIDEDKSISIIDALIIARHIVGMPTILGTRLKKITTPVLITPVGSGISVIKSGKISLRLKNLVSHPYILKRKPQRVFIKVGLVGYIPEVNKNRIPLNCAIVIDKSGSMNGSKINQAKKAAIQAVNLMNKDDVVSVVLYDSKVNVLLPATKLTSKAAVINKIQQIRASGSTAIYAGVRQGETEIKKFLKKNEVNRILLLSDGLANVGPKLPGDFAELGTILVKDGISVTTIGLGLGYNEDLMRELANKSDGNHYFVETAIDLVRIFEKEFDTIFKIVAQQVAIVVECPPWVRPIRVLGREALLEDRRIKATINQLYQDQEKYLLFEVEIYPENTKDEFKIATVDLSFQNAEGKTEKNIKRSISARCSDSQIIVDQNENTEVMVDAILQIATDQNIAAMKVRDKGDITGAKKLLSENAAYLQTQGDKYDSDVLRKYGTENLIDSNNLSEAAWNARRKAMNQVQHSNTKQQY